MRVAIGPGGIESSPIHMAYEVGGKSLQAYGRLFGQRILTRGAAQFIADDAWIVRSVPILNEAAVLATEGRTAWTCVGATLYAIGRGWLP